MRLTLRPKMMLAVLGPLAIVLALLAWAQYDAHQRMLLQTAEQTAFDLSSVIKGSLRQAMLRQDRIDTQVTIDNIAADPQVINLMLLDRGATVRAAAPRSLLGAHLQKTDGGCVDCHPGGGTAVRTSPVVADLSDGRRVLRSWSPIENVGVCHACHDPSQPYIGVLITDISMASIDAQTRSGLRQTLLLSGGALLLGAALFGVTLERSVLKPVGRLTRAIRDLGSGNLARRVRPRGQDEIAELGSAFNQMADGIQEKDRLEQQVRQHTTELEQLYDALQEKEAARSQLLKQVINAQEDERKRVARELHDELAQSLVGLVMSLDSADEILPPEMESARRQLARTRAISSSALGQTRQLILDLRPTMLDDLGLAPAVRWYAETHLGAEGTAVTFQAQGQQRRLPPELETTVFRIAQEAINNVKKHAHAGAVSIVLRWEPRQIVLGVHDDGRGFDVQGAYHPLEAGSGIGLLGMRERAEMFAGHLTIRSDPGEGTSIEVCLPLAGEENGDDNPGPDC